MHDLPPRGTISTGSKSNQTISHPHNQTNHATTKFASDRQNEAAAPAAEARRHDPQGTAAAPPLDSGLWIVGAFGSRDFGRSSEKKRQNWNTTINSQKQLIATVIPLHSCLRLDDEKCTSQFTATGLGLISRSSPRERSKVQVSSRAVCTFEFCLHLGLPIPWPFLPRVAPSCFLFPPRSFFLSSPRRSFLLSSPTSLLSSFFSHLLQTSTSARTLYSHTACVNRMDRRQGGEDKERKRQRLEATKTRAARMRDNDPSESEKDEPRPPSKNRKKQSTSSEESEEEVITLTGKPSALRKLLEGSTPSKSKYST